MITLTLLHPVQSTPVQSWTFEQEPVIRIGRAMDNHVVLYSAVVSRHHVELRRSGNLWEVVNLGTNGTYLDGKRVHQAPLEDGGIIRLARSGPNLHVRLGPVPVGTPVPRTGNVVPPASEDAKATDDKATIISPEAEDEGSGDEEPAADDEEDDRGFYVAGIQSFPFVRNGSLLSAATCQHRQLRSEDLFCIDCGYPLRIWQTIGPYQALKPLGTSGNTFLAWRDRRTLVLRTINPEGAHLSRLKRLFRQQVQAFCQLDHPGLPPAYEGFSVEGQPFLVTEMVHGVSLWQWVLDHGPVKRSQVIAWTIQICRTLAYLHQQYPPVVHQGVRPSNLIRVNVPRGDFEIVLAGLGQVTLVTPEVKTFINAVAYAAPEVQEGRVYPASDLYALGVTMVYLLTGQDPDNYYRWGAEEFRLYVEDIPQLPVELAAVLKRLTAPLLEDRYASAQDAIVDLQRLS